MLVFSIFCDFSLIHGVFINIRTPGSQFDNYILLHSYIALLAKAIILYLFLLSRSISSQDTCGNIGVPPYYLRLLGVVLNTL